MDVNGPGAAEEVVTPDLLQQLGAGEDPAGMLGEVLEQFELFVGQVQRATAQSGRVGALIDHQLTEVDFPGALLVGKPPAPADQQAQPGLDLGGTSAGKKDFVDAPVDVHRDKTALVDHRDHRH